MWILTDTYYNYQSQNGASYTDPIDLGQTTNIEFSVGVGLSGGDFTVTFISKEEHYNISKGYVVGCIKSTDNDTPVVFGVASKITIDEKKQETVINFSGINRMLRGIYLPCSNLNYLSGGIVGELAYKIQASSKIGVLRNIMDAAYARKSYGSLPFVWDTPTQTGTAYTYNVYNGDYKVLSEVLSDYIERENVPAFRWTFSQTTAGASRGEPSVAITQIGTQTTPIRLQTQAIIDITPFEYDSSNCVGLAFFVTQTTDETTNTQYYDTQVRHTKTSFMPLQASISGHDNVVETATKLAYCQERIAQTPSASVTVTLSQRYGTSGNNGEVFAPSNIGKIVCFPYNTSGSFNYAYDEVGREVSFVYGVVTEAKYVNDDTVELTLNNVQVQETDTLDIAAMGKQTSTPKTVTNLLNTLSNNLGSQSVKPRI